MPSSKITHKILVLMNNRLLFRKMPFYSVNIPITKLLKVFLLPICICLCLSEIALANFQQKPTPTGKNTKIANTDSPKKSNKKKKNTKTKRVAKVDSTDIDPTQMKAPLFQN